MKNNYFYIFKYLRHIGVSIDSSEFLFQLYSHPYYWSLLGISDTLKFLNINNTVYEVPFSEIDILPNSFIGLLKKEKESELCFIERKKEKFKVVGSSSTYLISKSQLKAEWQNVVMVVEKSQTSVQTNGFRQKWIYIITTISIVYWLLITRLSSQWYIYLWGILPFIGLTLSVMSLKDLFRWKNKVVENFCNLSGNEGCAKVSTTNKWKIFEYVPFSDVSLIFFFSQLTTFSFFLVSDSEDYYFHIQLILLLSSIPFLIISFIYQKIVVKAWCPICLSIALILVLQFIFLIISFDFKLEIISVSSFISYFLITSIAILSWVLLKNTLNRLKNLEEYQIETNKTLRNFEVFKKSLVSSEEIKFSEDSVVLGNKDSKKVISMVTNPFCKYCSEAHKMIENILNLYGREIRVEIIFNVSIDQLEEEKLSLFRSLINIYFQDGEHHFLTALDDWFENKNINLWLARYKNEKNIGKADKTLRNQKEWCTNTGYFMTPSLFLNGYPYPKAYSRDVLIYLIPDFIDDEKIKE